MYNLLKNYYSNINNDTTIRDILLCIENDYEKIPECQICGKTLHMCRDGHIPYYHFPIFCSKECRIKQKGYPPKEEVIMKYEELKSQQKVANFYGLTRKIIVNILKT